MSAPEPHHRAKPEPLDWLDPAVQGQVRQAIEARPVYRDRGGPIEMVQTHISTVFLTPRYVFKFKRPVSLGFADFHTLRRRRHFCNEEVRLNRRLARDVYLKVLPLWQRRNGSYTFERGQRIVDYAVVMKRLPREAMLDYRIAHAEVLPGEIERLADFLARFHMRAKAPARASHYGDLETWRLNWEENFQQIEPAVGRTLSRERLAAIRDPVRDFMTEEAERLRDRVAGGSVRSGHGDLRCEHICLGSRIRIIDCIEFNERFRYGDVANDLAFLVMDMMHMGRVDLARQLCERYFARTGDTGARALMPFYICYRAFVRAKVATLRLQDPSLSPEERAPLERQADRFFALAESTARLLARPVMIVVSGLMGTGKSTLARALAARTGTPVFASDRVRKDLAAAALSGLDPAETSQAPFGSGIYTTEWNQRTYNTLLERAEAELRARRSVIVDAAFSRSFDRQRALSLARKLGAESFVVECRVPDEVAIGRLTERERTGGALSDGRAGLYDNQKAAFEPIDERLDGRHLVLDSSRPVDDLVDDVLERTHLPFPDLFAEPSA